MRRINMRHLAPEPMDASSLPRDLPVVQYGQLLLPGNTDQWEMGADYNRRKNVECMLMYVQLVCDDAVFALKRLLVRGSHREVGPSGAGGVYHDQSHISSPASTLHWPPLQKHLADALQVFACRLREQVQHRRRFRRMILEHIFRCLAAKCSLLMPRTPRFWKPNSHHRTGKSRHYRAVLSAAAAAHTWITWAGEDDDQGHRRQGSHHRLYSLGGLSIGQ